MFLDSVDNILKCDRAGTFPCGVACDTNFCTEMLTVEILSSFSNLRSFLR